MGEKINDGGPAFPETRWDDRTRQEFQWTGMSLRDYFAAAALQGMLATFSKKEASASLVTDGAYRFADAMLAARERKEGSNG